MNSRRRREDRDIACERLEHREAEALGVRGYEHRVRRIDRQRDVIGRRGAERDQANARGELARPVVALPGSLRVEREQQAGFVATEPERQTRRLARDRTETVERDATRKHDRRGCERPEFIRELLGHGGNEVHVWQRCAGEPARAGVAHVGAVERHGVKRPPQCERRPGGEPEVRVHDVETACVEPPAQRSGGERV